MAKGRTEEAAEGLLDLVLDGTFPPGSSLPSEAELARRFGVSRLTMREAIRSLAATRVIAVSHGKSSVVRPADQWSPLDARLLRARGELAGQPLLLPRRLLEARRMVEVSTAETAAERRSDEHLGLLSHYISEMRAAHEVTDVPRFVDADLAFHQTIFKAVDNVFLDALFEPLDQVIRRLRAETSSVSDIRVHAIFWHTKIYEAIKAGDPGEAREMMRGHLVQTQDDMESYLAEDQETAGAQA
jgi:GntR family transcriptional repressor for pyruvate dehydrogenase complex